MDNVGTQLLMKQIIRQAVSDYNYILTKRRTKPNALMADFNELIHFFKSEWFYALSWGVDGDYMLSLLGEDGCSVTDSRGRVRKIKKREARPPRKVSPEEGQLIVRLHDEDGLTMKQISEKLDRSAGAISNIYQRYKYPRPNAIPHEKYSQEIVEKGFKLRDTTNMTWNEIAKVVNVPAYSLIQRYNREKRKREVTDND